MTRCRICGGSAAEMGTVEYIKGYAWEIFDCSTCGCRFTKHDASIYDVLHRSGAISYYNEYKSLAQQCEGYFIKDDRAGLEQVLGKVSKYRFIIERAAAEPAEARLLEIGSSRGYLTSHFIL